MNRPLQYLKNIRFNPIINKTAAQQSKKKYMVNNSNKRIQQVIVRKYTTYSNRNPLPPNQNDPFWVVIILASSFGLSNIIKSIYYDKK
jgi:hypothetical protein